MTSHKLILPFAVPHKESLSRRVDQFPLAVTFLDSEKVVAGCGRMRGQNY